MSGASPISRAAIAIAALGVVTAASRAGVTNPFTEDFAAGPSNWLDASSQDTLSWFATGGPDGGSYVSTSYLVPDPIPPFGAIVFRGNGANDASNGAFTGDWITAGVSEFSFSIRHDAPTPLSVFARWSVAGNFPGFAGVWFDPILPNTWTQITIPIYEGSPYLFDEGFPFDAVFSAIENVQIGINPSMDLIGQNITIDLDKVAIAPSPGAVALLGLAAVGGVGRRRRR